MLTTDTVAEASGVVRMVAPGGYVLRRIRRDTGREPRDVIAEAIAQTPTFDEAAALLGCSARTLRKLRAELGIVVEDHQG